MNLTQAPCRCCPPRRIGPPNGRGWGVFTSSLAILLTAGCQQMIQQTDQDVGRLIAARQQAALGRQSPVRVGRGETEPKPPRSAYAYNPSPTTGDVPASFSTPTSQPATAPAMSFPTEAADATPGSQPATRPRRLFTLTDALAYAQQQRREYQSAKEDLYLAALALTLERHLWTPIFASNLKTVYGNYGEARNFDQAMRFVADLAVSQRLPYGGEFTAAMVSTLIRDVKKTITAAEGSNIELGLKVPFLRGAGHVAREKLIQLERELTYAVRAFERYRRQQLVTVAESYFDLLRFKQQVRDARASLERAVNDFQRASAMEETGRGTLLDTQGAELNMLQFQDGLQRSRESFRAQCDRFKLVIGMPVDEPLDADDLEDIETIERRIREGQYPLLAPPQAVKDEDLAIQVALERRLDLLTLHDRIDDARRGVAISRNALLPELNWNSTLTFDTDPNHYNMGAFEFERANWRTELVLSLPLERSAERVELRRALINVQQAQRAHQEQAERIRAEVRSAVNQLRLQETALRIQERKVIVTASQAEFANMQFEDGKVDNRYKTQAERDLLAAQDALNQAKTSRWAAVLAFRLATETLLIEEDGTQQENAEPIAAP